MRNIIGNEEKELISQLNYLKEQKLKLDDLAKIDIRADLHKPTEKTIQSPDLKIDKTVEKVKYKKIMR